MEMGLSGPIHRVVQSSDPRRVVDGAAGDADGGLAAETTHRESVGAVLEDGGEGGRERWVLVGEEKSGLYTTKPP